MENQSIQLMELATIQYNREICKKIAEVTKYYPAIVLTGARQTGK